MNSTENEFCFSLKILPAISNRNPQRGPSQAGTSFLRFNQSTGNRWLTTKTFQIKQSFKDKGIRLFLFFRSLYFLLTRVRNVQLFERHDGSRDSGADASLRRNEPRGGAAAAAPLLQRPSTRTTRRTASGLSTNAGRLTIPHHVTFHGSSSRYIGYDVCITSCFASSSNMGSSKNLLMLTSSLSPCKRPVVNISAAALKSQADLRLFTAFSLWT